MLKKLPPITIAALTPFFILAVMSCGLEEDTDSDEALGNGSCQLPVISGYDMCHDHQDWSSDGLEQAKSDCEGGTFGAAGTWTEGSLCPTSGDIGTCTWSAGSDSIVTHYTAPDAATAKAHCESSSEGWGGSWTGSTNTGTEDTSGVTALNFYAPENSLSDFSCVQITINAMNGTNLGTTESALEISLSATSGFLYSDSTCQTKTTSVIMAASSQTAIFFYRSTQNGTHVVTATASDTSIAAASATMQVSMEVVGNRVSTCYSDDGEMVQDSLSINEDGTFSTSRKQFSEDSSCTTLELTLLSSGTYSIGFAGKDSLFVPIDFTYSAFTVTVHGTGIRDAFNSASSTFWGISNWEVDVAQDVLGRTGPMNRSDGAVLQNVYNIYETKVTVGLNMGSSTETPRPTAISEYGRGFDFDQE